MSKAQGASNADVGAKSGDEIWKIEVVYRRTANLTFRSECETCSAETATETGTRFIGEEGAVEPLIFLPGWA